MNSETISKLFFISVDSCRITEDGKGVLAAAADHLLMYRQENVSIVHETERLEVIVTTDFEEFEIGTIVGTKFTARISENGQTIHADFVIQEAGTLPREFHRGWEFKALRTRMLYDGILNN